MAAPKCDVRNLTVEQVTIFTIIVILAGTGLGLCGWMAATAAAAGVDLVGVSVGVIFIVLALLQTGFTVLWHIMQQRQKAEFHPNRDEMEIEKEVAI